MTQKKEVFFDTEEHWKELTREAKALGVSFARINQRNIDQGYFHQPHKFARALVHYLSEVNGESNIKAFNVTFADFPKANFTLARQHHYIGKTARGNIELGQKLIDFRKRRELKKAKTTKKELETQRVLRRLKIINRDIERVMKLIEREGQYQ